LQLHRIRVEEFGAGREKIRGLSRALRECSCLCLWACEPATPNDSLCGFRPCLPLVREPKGLWRLANTRTLWGDLFNRPVCGFV
jgi:hypothetical protein